jgi:hypothetical protein
MERAELRTRENGGRSETNPLSARLPFFLFLFALLLNLFGAAYVATEGDASGEARLVLDPDGPARPNHLVQTQLFRAVYEWARAFGFDGPVFVPLQILNGFLGAVLAALLVAFFRSAEISSRAAAFAAVVWVLSSAPWFHSRTAETGITPLPFLVGSFLVLFRVGGNARASLGRAALAAALFAGSVLLSLTSALLAPAFLVLLVERSSRKATIGALATFALLAGGPFVIASAAEGVRPDGFLGWLASHPGSTGIAAGSPIGFLRALTGIGRAVFPASGGETAFKAFLVGAEVQSTARDWLTMTRNVAATLVFVGTALAGAWKLRRSALGIASMLAILVTGAFNCYWLGSDPQFWLPVVPFLLLLAARALDGILHAPRRATWVLSCVAIVILYLSNVAVGPPTLLHPSGDDRWQGAKRLAARLPHAALVLRPGVGRSPLEFLEHFRPDVTVLNLSYSPPRSLTGTEALAWLDAEIEGAHAMRREVYFEGLTGPLSPALLGPWGYSANARGISRTMLRERLEATYRVIPETDLAAHLARIVPPEEASAMSGT